MKLKQIAVQIGMKYVPPGGDRYQPRDLNVGIGGELEEGDDPRKCLDVLRRMAKEELILQQKEIS